MIELGLHSLNGASIHGRGQQEEERDIWFVVAWHVVLLEMSPHYLQFDSSWQISLLSAAGSALQGRILNVGVLPWSLSRPIPEQDMKSAYGRTRANPVFAAG